VGFVYQAEGEAGGAESAGLREGRRGDKAALVVHARAASASSSSASVVGEDAGAGGAIEHATEAHQEARGGLETLAAGKEKTASPPSPLLAAIPAARDPTNPPGGSPQIPRNY